MKIHGTWFEFQHAGAVEGKYWNAAFRGFRPDQWEALLSEMAGLGMEYLVLMCSALDSKTFYQSRYFESFPMQTPNPMELMFNVADRLGLKIFVSNDFFGSWSDPAAMCSAPEIYKTREKATREIADTFASHPSFFGWYWPNEASIYPYYEDAFVNYVNVNSALARQLTPGKKTLIAPYGTFRALPDDHFCRQLEMMDVDFVAYQDEIGVRKANVEWTPYFFEQLKRAHDKVGRGKIWADVEVFRFEGKVYNSALLPAEFSRIKSQMEAIAPFVEHILIYQYPGLMSKPGSAAFTPHPAATQLYEEYAAYLTATPKDP